MFQHFKNQLKVFQHNPFGNYETNGKSLISNSYKVFLRKYNKTVVIKKIVFSRKYSLKSFINNLEQYLKVELHENILKLISIIEEKTHEIIIIREYPCDGTFHQYLSKNFSILNWNDKLRLAKQLTSAIKCLHENDIIHMNLNSDSIFVNRGDIKISAFQFQNEFSNMHKFIPYTDPQYFQLHKLNKSSDIYSIGVLLWQISSGIIPFKFELPYDFNLFIAIVSGKREVAILNSNQRPTIQHVFEDLNNIDYNYNSMNNEEIITELDNKIELKAISESKDVSLNTTELLKYYTDLYDRTTFELELITSIMKIIKKENNIIDRQSDKLYRFSKSLFTNKEIINDEHKFLHDLMQLFISQYKIQGVSKNTSSSIIYCINKCINDNHKTPSKVLDEYYNHQYRFYFTSIVGFFYEHGIGTAINYSKALDMYNQATKDYCLDHSNTLSSCYFTNNLLKENQIIGLISLGILYTDGKSVE
ncbi:8177_t:CDS:2, partial [Racocetra persica]